MSALEIIGVISLLIWVPVGMVLVTALIFEDRVSPAMMVKFYRWYYSERKDEENTTNCRCEGFVGDCTEDNPCLGCGGEDK